jgi:hypothetical protein
MKLAADLFHFEEHEYLAMTDYYRNFVEVDRLLDTKSGSVVWALKAQFARHGIYRVLDDEQRSTIYVG